MKKTIKTSNGLCRYTFRIYTDYDPEDGFSVWTNAYSQSEAESYIRGEYWGITRISLMSVEQIKN